MDIYKNAFELAMKEIQSLKANEEFLRSEVEYQSNRADKYTETIENLREELYSADKKNVITDDARNEYLDALSFKSYEIDNLKIDLKQAHTENAEWIAACKKTDAWQVLALMGRKLEAIKIVRMINTYPGGDIYGLKESKDYVEEYLKRAADEA